MAFSAHQKSRSLRHPLLWALLVSLALHSCLIGSLHIHFPHPSPSTKPIVLQIRLPGPPTQPVPKNQIVHRPASQHLAPHHRGAQHVFGRVQNHPQSTALAINPLSMPAQEASAASGSPSPKNATPATKPTPATIPTGLTLLPNYFELHYQVAAGPGGLMRGRSSFVWLRRNDQYVLASIIEARGLAGMLATGRLTQISVGHITASGLQPDRYEIHRGDNSPQNATTIHMDYTQAQAHVTRHEQSYDETLPDNAEDLLSVVFDLASLSPLDQPIELQVSSGKAFQPYHFRMAGHETLNTALGRLNTIHLQRPPDRDGDSMDIWFAPDLHNMPVRVLIHHSTWGVIDQTLTDWLDHNPDQAPANPPDRPITPAKH